MVTINRLTVGQLQTNCYIISDNKNSEAIIIDPGDDADYISQKITDLGAKPILIVATHGHFDHVLAVKELKLAFDVPFYINPNDEFLLKKARSSSLHFTGIDPLVEPPKIDVYLKNTIKLNLGSCSFKVIFTPGHTPGSCSLYSSKAKIAFVGDLLFSDGTIGRYDFSYSSKDVLDKSIKTILGLPKHTTLFSGHGEAFTVGSVQKSFKTSFRVPRASELGDE